jgi:DNA-nicking Smr family endonuclease
MDKLDLHGLTVDEAHDALSDFVVAEAYLESLA